MTTEAEKQTVPNTFRNILITGANRGIGLAYVRHLLSPECEPSPRKVIATSRKSDCAELQQLAAKHADVLHTLRYDATDYASYAEFVRQVESILGANEGIDLLINNAGVYMKASLAEHTLDPKTILDNINVNAIAPLKLTESLLPLLERSAAAGKRTVIANISSTGGSIGENGSGGSISYSYRASKAVMNMFGKSLAVDLAGRNIIVLQLHPGWVRTDMGGERALVDARTSVDGMRRLIERCDAKNSGQFLHFQGREISW